MILSEAQNLSGSVLLSFGRIPIYLFVILS